MMPFGVPAEVEANPGAGVLGVTGAEAGELDPVAVLDAVAELDPVAEPEPAAELAGAAECEDEPPQPARTRPSSGVNQASVLVMSDLLRVGILLPAVPCGPRVAPKLAPS
jgi:hypothetical protein